MDRVTALRTMDADSPTAPFRLEKIMIQIRVVTEVCIPIGLARFAGLLCLVQKCRWRTSRKPRVVDYQNIHPISPIASAAAFVRWATAYRTR